MSNAMKTVVQFRRSVAVAVTVAVQSSGAARFLKKCWFQKMLAVRWNLLF